MEEIRALMQEANESIATTNIKGKEYAEVPQRVKAFRYVYPKGCISTEIISLENGVVTMKATITDENGQVLATGLAYEKENSTFINKTSYIENCETSAVGRALGFCGFGVDKSIASAEEVQTAIANQQKKEEKPKVEKVGNYGIEEVFRELFSEEEIKKILKHYNVRKVETLPIDVARRYIESRDTTGEKLSIFDEVKEFY